MPSPNTTECRDHDNQSRRIYFKYSDKKSAVYAATFDSVAGLWGYIYLLSFIVLATFYISCIIFESTSATFDLESNSCTGYVGMYAYVEAS